MQYQTNEASPTYLLAPKRMQDATPPLKAARPRLEKRLRLHEPPTRRPSENAVYEVGLEAVE